MRWAIRGEGGQCHPSLLGGTAYTLTALRMSGTARLPSATNSPLDFVMKPVDLTKPVEVPPIPLSLASNDSKSVREAMSKSNVKKRVSDWEKVSASASNINLNKPKVPTSGVDMKKRIGFWERQKTHPINTSGLRVPRKRCEQAEGSKSGQNEQDDDTTGGVGRQKVSARYV